MRSRDSLEDSVREMWTEVLGVSDVDAHTTWFDAGGDSLEAMRPHRRSRVSRIC